METVASSSTRPLSEQLLKHTKLTCVHYPPGDTAGKLLAHASLLPVLALVGQAAKVYTRREVHEAALLLGLVAEEAVARALKHLFKHPRPATCALLHLCHSHGMPSSHTSMACCIAVVATCAAARHFRQQQHTLSQLLSAAEVAAAWVGAAAVAASRVYLGYHSTDQVLAGAALGLVWGAALAVLLHALQPLYGAVARVRMLQQLGVKDTYGCAQPLLVEAAAHAEAAAAGDSRALSAKATNGKQL